MDGLQIAQIIADLQTLQNAEPAAAQNLLSANKVLSARAARRKSKSSIATSKQILKSPPSLTPQQSTSSSLDTLSPKLVRFDTNGSSGYFPSGSLSGSLSRKESTESGGGERGGNEEAEDEDMKRAKTLVQLFQMRGKFQQMGDTGLSRAKEKVDGVVSTYAAKDLEERENIARARFLGVPS